MRSALPKALHPIAGRPMLRHLIDSCAAAFDRIVVVLGPEMDALAAIAAPHPCVVQHERLGTAHAALQAQALFGDGTVAVLYADNPLVATATLDRLLARAGQGKAGHGTTGQGDAALALLGMRPPEPGKLRPRDRRRRLRRAHRRMGGRHGRGARRNAVQCGRARRTGGGHAALAPGRAQRQRETGVLPDGRGGAGPRGGRRGCGGGAPISPSCAASTRAPSWPRRRPACRPRCAGARWTAASP